MCVCECVCQSKCSELGAYAVIGIWSSECRRSAMFRSEKIRCAKLVLLEYFLYYFLDMDNAL